MKIISSLENLQTKINNVKAPILQEIEANNEKICKIEIKKSELLKEINSNDIRPIIKAKKLKELNNINSEIAVLNEDCLTNKEMIVLFILACIMAPLFVLNGLIFVLIERWFYEK